MAPIYGSLWNPEMGGKVISVLGPIEPSELGLTDAHNHLWIAPWQESSDLAIPVLDQFDPIRSELEAYRRAGGGSQVDCQPGGAGRDGVRLKELSQASAVNVIACTGFHLQDYYPPGARLWQLDNEAALEYFLSELNEGLSETGQLEEPVRAGFIKIAVRESLDQSPKHLIEAAAEASKQSGCAIEMHTEKGAGVEAFVDYFLGLGLSLSRLVICHIDKRPDLALHQELAQAGCLLEYDTFFRQKYSPEENVWRLIPRMVEAGWQNSIALATDLADHNLWSTMGTGPGLLGFAEQIRRRLDSLFADQATVANLMGNNIASRLALKI